MNKTSIQATALDPGDKFHWSGEDWYCDEKPQNNIEPGFVWFRAIRAEGGQAMDLRIGKLETVGLYEAA